MYESSGSTAEQRAEEAIRIISLLEKHQSAMEISDFDFYTKQRENLMRYGKNTFISPKQLFWLRDIKDKFL